MTDTTTTSTDLVLSGFPASQLIAKAIELNQRITLDETATAGQIAERVASATSIEDVFGSGEPLTKVKDILGTTIKVIGIDGVRSSDYDGGLGIFLIVNAVNPDGEQIKVSVGVSDGILKLVKLAELGALPRQVAFEESSKKTAAGYYPINLVDREPAAPAAAADPKVTGDF